jgi:pyridoxal phosphate enzyme (YggS family)
VSDRREALRAGLETVRERIQAACAAAGREPGEVTTVVVTKFFPASDIEHLVELGVADIGENKDQEAAAKVDELPEAVRRGLRVHFIGQLQTNKVRSVVRYADLVHSVDRPKLARTLDRAAGSAVEAGERDGPLPVLLQVDLEEGDRAGRGGAAPGELDELAAQVATAEHLHLRGLMAVAPPDLGEAGTAAAFERLHACAESVREQHPGADVLSAGMSGDLEHAVRHGATHLRVGSAILGPRPRP